MKPPLKPHHIELFRKWSRGARESILRETPPQVRLRGEVYDTGNRGHGLIELYKDGQLVSLYCERDVEFIYSEDQMEQLRKLDEVDKFLLEAGE